jgi:tryptophan 2,3-dioxygenase
VNYWDYIRVEDLLKLQSGTRASEDDVSNDEVLFIVVHQVYELWFKLVLRELDAACALFDQKPVPDMALAKATRSFRRITTIFDQAITHFSVMETLTTRDYLSFRDTLIGASGFQSAQLREMEIVLGLEEGQRISLGVEGTYKDALKAMDGSSSPALARVERRLGQQASLRTLIYRWLARTPVGEDGGSPQQFLEGFLASHARELDVRLAAIAKTMKLPAADVELWKQRYERDLATTRRFLFAEDGDDLPGFDREERMRVRAAILFLESYRELPRLAWPREALDALIEMEQRMVIWRQRHARMVERIIGRRTGTGGSAGVEYLDQTALKYRVFGDVWAVRTILLKKDAVPEIPNADDFRFRIQDE